MSDKLDPNLNCMACALGYVKNASTGECRACSTGFYQGGDCKTGTF